jgi:predicted DNA-binding transcriptional regulator YafY
MEDIRLSEEPFQRKTPAPAENPGGGPPPVDTIEVIFRADTAVAFRIFDEYSRADIVQDEDGRLLVRAVLPRGEWLAGYFLTYGAQVEVLEPLSLRTELQTVLREALKKYENI